MGIRSMYLACGLAGLLFVGGCRDDGAGRAEPAHSKAALASQTDTGVTPVHNTLHYPTPQRQPGEFLALVPPTRSPQETALLSVPVTDVPTIDGRADESVWDAAPAVTTLDFSSQREITLKSVHTATQIFFLVTYPDSTPSETHKSWGWDAKDGIYKQMEDREDVFLFKWSLVGNDVSLAFRDAQPHHADIWYWKARRTNPSGYADDKWQTLSPEAHKEAKRVPSTTHSVLYLRREGDAGQSAYEEKLIYEYQGDVVPRFYPGQPQGSRADVRAKGLWHDGRWTIEFARQLQTGHADDIAFTRSGVYLFAVSCYEMAHDEVYPEWFQPLYRTGEAFDRLLLRIATVDDRLAKKETQ